MLERYSVKIKTEISIKIMPIAVQEFQLCNIVLNESY